MYGFPLHLRPGISWPSSDVCISEEKKIEIKELKGRERKGIIKKKKKIVKRV